MKTQHRRTILAVDDDEINLMILSKCVQEAGYKVKPFTSGDDAWQYLQSNPDSIDIALVDKMMPGMSGTELLKHIKSDTRMRHMPVIIQTGDAGLVQMREGLENGAYYYLTKPFHPEILAAIIHSAASECTMREDLIAQMAAGHSRFIGLIREGDFAIRTHAEAGILSAAISQAAVYPEFVAIGLMELLSNAIEHGNLDIGYQKKRKCLLSNQWQNEIATRASSNEYAQRAVRVHIEKTEGGIQLAITDEGKGFDWRYYLYDENAPGRLNEPNGRGIAKALIMLDDLRYTGKGNEVHCTIGLSSSARAGQETGISPDIRHS